MFSLRVPFIFQTTDNITYNTTALTRVPFIGEVMYREV
jgi:hypothetical protein